MVAYACYVYSICHVSISNIKVAYRNPVVSPSFLYQNSFGCGQDQSWNSHLLSLAESASFSFDYGGGVVTERRFLLDRGRIKLDALKAAFKCPYLVLYLGE